MVMRGKEMMGEALSTNGGYVLHDISFFQQYTVYSFRILDTKRNFCTKGRIHRTGKIMSSDL